MTWHDDRAAARAVPLDLAVVESVVAAAAPGARLVDTTPLDGGLSGLCDVLHLEGVAVDRLVLRRSVPALGHDADSARTEVAAHAVATRHGVAAPAVRWSDPDGRHLGVPALVMDFVPGRPIVGALDDPVAARAFADVIGDLHAVRPTAGGGLARLRDVRAHEDRFGPPPATSDVVDAGSLRSAVAALAPSFVPGDHLVHGDLHGGNVLWDGTTVTGVLDWPGAAVGVRWWDEAYAVMDTAFAHGPAAGEGLLAALRARPAAPIPSDAEWALWSGVALVRALPSPGEWGPGYAAAGCPVSPDTLDARFVDAVAGWMDAHG